jgi:oxygen-independent coproporphyrinogen-3 oxidase
MVGAALMELGVYIHYPWCRSGCSNCDFAIAVAPPGQAPPHDRYLAAVLEELDHRAPAFAGRALASIYLGGGTPSLWPADHLARAIAAVRGRFADDGTAEITLEANPTDCTPAALAAWRAAGVTRLSIGVQSFDPADLVVLGRDHAMGDGGAALDAAAGAGFALSADLIVGAPGARDPLEQVARLIERGPPHLSIYELTIEPGTPLAARIGRGELVREDDDRLADLYEAIHRLAERAGYVHYEISSYARPGHEARHNSRYWSGGAYLGLGNGAHSLRRTADGGGIRWSNHRSVGRYLGAAVEGREAAREILSPEAMAVELAWLGMRTRRGVPRSAFAAHPELPAWLVGHGLAEEAGDRLRPTLRGFLMSDTVAARIVSGFGYAPGAAARPA